MEWAPCKIPQPARREDFPRYTDEKNALACVLDKSGGEARGSMATQTMCVIFYLLLSDKTRLWQAP